MRTKETKIAGIVILYNPSGDVTDNILTYLPSLNRLYIVDNSENREIDNYTRIEPDKIKYHYCGGNTGVAAALNKGLMMAIDENYDYCFLFDQDSQASPNLIEIVSNYLVSSEADKIGIYSAVPDYLVEKIKDSPKNELLEVAITSGSLLSLKVYKIVGPFSDKLFIDYVDFEYCLRIRKAGFKIIRMKDALIYHKLGNLEKRTFLLKNIFVTNHPPIRYYYRTRNRFYVYKKYFLAFPLFVTKDLMIFINELIKIIFYESNRGKKLQMIKKGLFDFTSGRYGKLG